MPDAHLQALLGSLAHVSRRQETWAQAGEGRYLLQASPNQNRGDPQAGAKSHDRWHKCEAETKA